MQNYKTVWSEPSSYHLIDAADTAKLRIALNLPANLACNTICFNLGIDSLTNSQGAKGGDLDPALGMYWAWHSGYINLKLEGTSPACASPVATRKHAFQYHLGGFRAGEYALQKITLPVANELNITIQTDISAFINALNLREQPMLMTPGARAIALSRLAATMFSTHPHAD